MRLSQLFRGLLLIATLVALGYAFKFLDIQRLFDEAWIDAMVRGHGLQGELLFVAVAGLFCAIGLPRQVTSFLAGYGFGLGVGVVLGLLATLLGCMLTFGYARLIGRGLFATHLGPRLQRVETFLLDNTFGMTVLIRLLPAGSNFLLNLLAGIGRIRPLPFFAGSALGYIPQTLVFVLIGSGIGVDPALRILGGVALFIVSGLLGLYLYQKFRRGRSLDEGDEHSLSQGARGT